MKHVGAPEDIDYRVARGLDRTLFNWLLTGSWIKEHQDVLITGLTGLGKTWLACALTNLCFDQSGVSAGLFGSVCARAAPVRGIGDCAR